MGVVEVSKIGEHIWAKEALERFIAERPEKVLDIGAGEGKHATLMRQAGIDVTEVTLPDDYLEVSCGTYDGIWCSHVLEHQVNPGIFLQKIFSDLEDNGVLCITVPPAKHNIVGGHVTIWNEGLLLYNLILAGFDCQWAKVGVYGYNISVLVRKAQAELPALKRDKGDLELLRDFFPCAVKQGFDGRIGNLRW